MLAKKIQERIQLLSNEAHKIHSDKKLLEKKIAEIEIRTHQVVGALHELQALQAVIAKEEAAAAIAAAAQAEETATPQEEQSEILDITLSSE